IKGSSSASGVVNGTPAAETVSDTFDLLGSARARLGWLPWSNLLVYGSGGLAWAQVMRQDFGESGGGGTVPTSPSTQQTWRWGWAAGLGAETRIGQGDWLGRIEYLHYDFGRTSDSSGVSNGVAFAVDQGRLTTDIIRAGLSYQLN